MYGRKGLRSNAWDNECVGGDASTSEQEVQITARQETTLNILPGVVLASGEGWNGGGGRGRLVADS